jgi:hypothetical protein
MTACTTSLVGGIGGNIAVVIYFALLISSTTNKMVTLGLSETNDLRRT